MTDLYTHERMPEATHRKLITEDLFKRKRSHWGRYAKKGK